MRLQNSSVDVEDKNKKINEYQSRIRELTEYCSEKDKKLLEANKGLESK